MTTPNLKKVVWGIGFLGLAIGFFAGCAANKPAPDQPRPGSGIAEFQQIAELSAQAIQSAMASLQTVAAQSNRCSPEAIGALSDSVQRLQVDSIQVRARSQAILARGDAYFERWHETMARVTDPEVRALAGKNHPRLQEKFRQIKQHSEQCRGAFKPFLSGLRTLRNSLESDPGSLRAPAAQEVLASARDQGRQLLEGLARIQAELDSMKAMLTPSANPRG